jgi:hypothetical protein
MGSKEYNNRASLGNRVKQEIYLKTMDECFRQEKPLTMDEISKKCQERINLVEKKLKVPLSEKFSRKSFYNYLEKLENESERILGIPLPLKRLRDGAVEEYRINKDGNLKTKDSYTTTYTYTDKGFTLFGRTLGEADRKKIQEIGAYLKNVSSRWQNDMLADITQGLEILQMDLASVEPKVQYELPYHLNENQLANFKKLYQAIEKKQVIQFEYDRHNIPGEEYFEGKSEEEIRNFKYKVIMSPYFLKQSNNRWYLLGKSHDQYLEFEDYLMPVSIERLKTLQIRNDIPFKPNPGITLKEYYKNLIGITLERNKEGKDCWFVTTWENLKSINNGKEFNEKKNEANSKGKSSIIEKKESSENRSEKKQNEDKSLFAKLFKGFEPEKDVVKSLKMKLDYGEFDKEKHYLMEFKGVPSTDLIRFIQTNKNDLKLLFPFKLVEGDFIFNNIRYVAIKISIHLYQNASDIGFKVVPEQFVKPDPKPESKPSSKITLEKKFNKANFNLLFGEGFLNEKKIIIVKSKGLKVDTDLLKLLEQPEISCLLSVLYPENLQRKAISPHDVKNIVLEVKKDFSHYIATKPFHESQQQIHFNKISSVINETENFKWNHRENKECHYFHLRLIPNVEFENLILAKGDQMKVIHPRSLRERLEKRTEKMFQSYHKSLSGHFTNDLINIEQIIQNLNSGISTLLNKESENFKRGLNELNISTHLGIYLTSLFSDYDVDNEYNGDIDKPNDRKALDIAKNRILEIGRKTNSKDNYKISPEIIIHKRGSNKSNLVVIEIKKDTHHQSDKNYDLIKLKHLTIDYSGNHYNYRLGVAIVFGTKENAGKYEMTFFQNGKENQQDKLV